MTRHLLLLIAVVCAAGWTSESYHPPEGDEAWQKGIVYLKPAGPFRKASGVAVFACNMAETQHRSQVFAKGLRAKALYTLWLVDMDGMKVARTHQMTSRWKPLRADRRGVITHIGNLRSCPASRDVVVVKYHPNEKAGAFKDGITVLKGYLHTMK